MQAVEAENAQLRANGLGTLPQFIQVIQTQTQQRFPSLVDTKGKAEARAHTSSVDTGTGRAKKGRSPEGRDSRQRGGPVNQAFGSSLGEEALGLHRFRVQEHLVQTTPRVRGRHVGHLSH
eukprot:4704541-Amphidinium_carterae.1